MRQTTTKISLTTPRNILAAATTGLVAIIFAAGSLTPVGASTVNNPLYDAACNSSVNLTTTGTANSSSFNELSGLATYRSADNIYWTHNDSGDSARFFSMDSSGNRLGTFNVSGVSATDWEDIDTGPGPVAGRTYIYIADTGDNDLRRKTVPVYRVSEPSPSLNGGTASVTAETIKFTYPDKAAHNVEAMFVDTNSEIYLIDKSSSRLANIYKSAANPVKGTTTKLTKVGTIGYPLNATTYELITGAAISPSGDAIAIRTYERLYIYNRPAGTTVASALASPACTMPAFTEPKGEAAAFNRSGNGLVTVGEGINQPIFNFNPLQQPVIE